MSVTLYLTLCASTRSTVSVQLLSEISIVPMTALILTNGEYVVIPGQDIGAAASDSNLSVILKTKYWLERV
jgi:hypothetical protein